MDAPTVEYNVTARYLLRCLTQLHEALPKLEGLVTDIRDAAELRGVDVAPFFTAYLKEMQRTHGLLHAVFRDLAEYQELLQQEGLLTAYQVRSLVIRDVIGLLQRTYPLPEDQ